MTDRERWSFTLILSSGVWLMAGCASDRVMLPAGHFPPPAVPADSVINPALSSTPPQATKKPSVQGLDAKGVPFDLPAAIAGADTSLAELPRFGKDVSQAERDAAVSKAYPTITPFTHEVPLATNALHPLCLEELQKLALANSPRIRKAQAEADVLYGQVIQAGLHPNPTVGYQVDQWQPNLRVPPVSTGSGAGQQGGYINLLIKTAGKLTLAQQVAGYDYINALVAVRKTHVEVTAQVRSAYFAAIVARQGIEVNTALAELADEVYRLQLKRVAAGAAANHEPYSFHALAIQARNAVAQADAAYKASRRQLAAAIGQPDLPLSTLAGRADAPPPALDTDFVKARLFEQHTDLLTSRNLFAQAQTNLNLQRRQLIPDLQTNTYHQYDNLVQTYQFGVQVGVQLPLSDRNQGNIRSARSKVAVAGESVRTTENELLAKLAEAVGRYEAGLKITSSYREQVIPDLTRAYRGVVHQFQVEPEKVGFNEVVVAQQNLAQALQAYLAALDALWKGVVDLAAVGQLDELYSEAAPRK